MYDELYAEAHDEVYGGHVAEFDVLEDCSAYRAVSRDDFLDRFKREGGEWVLRDPECRRGG